MMAIEIESFIRMLGLIITEHIQCNTFFVVYGVELGVLEAESEVVVSVAPFSSSSSSFSLSSVKTVATPNGCLYRKNCARLVNNG